MNSRYEREGKEHIHAKNWRIKEGENKQAKKRANQRKGRRHRNDIKGRSSNTIMKVRGDGPSSLKRPGKQLAWTKTKSPSEGRPITSPNNLGLARVCSSCLYVQTMFSCAVMNQCYTPATKARTSAKHSGYPIYSFAGHVSLVCRDLDR